MIINLPIKERTNPSVFSLDRMKKMRSSALTIKSIEQSPASSINGILRVPRYNRATDTPSLTANAHTARTERMRDGVKSTFDMAQVAGHVIVFIAKVFLE